MIFEIGQIIQIILQLLNARMSWKVWKLINGRWGLALTAGFLLMAIRRVTSLVTGAPELSNIVLVLDRVGLPLLITLFLFFGMKSILRGAQDEVCANRKTQERLRDLKEKFS